MKRIAIACALALLPAGAAAHIHMELVGDFQGLPPDGTLWRELYPTYPLEHTQIQYIDNGDGIISLGDGLRTQDTSLTEHEFHVAEVAAVYLLSAGNQPEAPYYEPLTPPDGTPQGDFWAQVAPFFGIVHQVTTWTDNGSGSLDACDSVVLENDPQRNHHVDFIRVMIGVELGPRAAEPRSWGGLKSLY